MAALDHQILAVFESQLLWLLHLHDHRPALLLLLTDITIKLAFILGLLAYKQLNLNHFDWFANLLANVHLSLFWT